MTTSPAAGGASNRTSVQAQLPGPPEPLLAVERQRRILQLLAAQDYITIKDVRRATGRSLATVYRDLAAMAKAGYLIRVHGGATRTNPIEQATQPALPVVPLRHGPGGGSLAEIAAAQRQAAWACERSRALRHASIPLPGCDSRIAADTRKVRRRGGTPQRRTALIQQEPLPGPPR